MRSGFELDIEKVKQKQESSNIGIFLFSTSDFDEPTEIHSSPPHSSLLPTYIFRLSRTADREARRVEVGLADW